MRAARRARDLRPPNRGTPQVHGAGFLGVLSVVLALVFLFSPLYLVQYAALFLLFIFLGSRAYSEYLVRHISLRRRDGELRVFRHEWVTVELLAENRGRFPALMLAVNDSPGRLSVFRDNKALCALKARSQAVIVWYAHCSGRGIFTLGPAAFRGSDPLGLFPFHVTAPETARLFVYPAPGMIALRNPAGLPLGTLISPNPLYEDMTRRRSLREYHSGDEPRRINWKATARTGGMMVNEYEPTVSYPLVVFLNADPSSYPLKKRELHLERAIEAAAALCLMASRDRQELGIVIYAPGSAEPLSVAPPSTLALIPIMERLAGLERAPGEGAAQNGAGGENSDSVTAGCTAAMLDRGKYLPYGARLVYAGPALTEREYLALDSLRRYRLSLEYLIIDERALSPAAGSDFQRYQSRRYQMKESGYEII
jgi:uncharacterized protein (DUF58 family)